MVWVLVPSLLTYPDSLLNSGNLHLTDTMPPWKKTCYLQYKERFLPPPAQNPTCTSDFSTGLLLCFIVIFKRILCKPRVGGQECIKPTDFLSGSWNASTSESPRLTRLAPLRKTPKWGCGLTDKRTDRSSAEVWFYKFSFSFTIKIAPAHTALG